MRFPKSLLREADRYAAEAVLRGGVDLERVRLQERKREEADALGMHACWNCLEPHDKTAINCPHCGTDVIPF
jgi:hypothetical protein